MATIPGQYWVDDCKFCTHRRKDDNVSENNHDYPCFFYHLKRENFEKNYKLEEHCYHFAPNVRYGICNTCKYFNSFHTDVDNEKDIYCTNKNGCLNRFDVFPNILKFNNSADYHVYTCERYEINASWKNTLLRMAIKGTTPRIFNPVTWELCEDENSPEWRELLKKQELECKRKLIEERRKKGHCKKHVERCKDG